MSILAPSDFTGKFELTINDFTVDKIQEYIDRYETISLIELFGKELYDLWVIGIGLSDPLYDTLNDPFIEQLSSGLIIQSKGVNDMLKGFIYFYYSRDAYTQATAQGNVKNNGQNSTNSSFAMSQLAQRYNESVDSYEAIQLYISNNIADYPTFLGCKKYPALTL